MQIFNQHSLSVSQKIAWDALNDIDILRKAIPGCELLVETEPLKYEVHVVATVGPVKAKFKGKMTLSELQPPVSYRIEFEGQGGAAGHGKGAANVRLEITSATTCTLHYDATASVGGKIAQIGQRLVDMAAQKMARDFFVSFNSQLEQLYPPPVVTKATEPVHAAAHISVLASTWHSIKSWFSRVFLGAS